MWNKSEIAEPVDGPGRGMIEGGSLSIKIIKTVLGGTNIIGKYSITQIRTRIYFERKKLEDEKQDSKNRLQKRVSTKGIKLFYFF